MGSVYSGMRHRWCAARFLLPFAMLGCGETSSRARAVEADAPAPLGPSPAAPNAPSPSTCFRYVPKDVRQHASACYPTMREACAALEHVMGSDLDLERDAELRDTGWETYVTLLGIRSLGEAA